jgi:hypothetical protein
LKDKKLLIEATKPFLILENSLSVDKDEIGPVERENIGLPQGQNMAIDPSCLSVLTFLIDVRTFFTANPEG